MKANQEMGARNATAISGAVMGATVGILGGVAGIGAAGLLGAVFGAVSGLALEHDLRVREERERDENAPAPTTPEERAIAEAAVGIEPACEDCLAVRAASASTTQWCARHSNHHVQAHLHHEYPESFAMGSLLIRPAA